MVSTRLVLVNEQASPPEVLDNCPTMQDIAIPIDFQISDLRNPGEGSGSHSYNVEIPGAPEVDKFFEDVYDVNISLQKFNPNLKVKAYYFVDMILNFEGNLQILEIMVDEEKKHHFYKVNIIGEVVTFFTKIKDKFLTDNTNSADDLDFSSYNHTLTYANITGSWSNTSGTGYVYPLVDWGTNNSNLSQVRPVDFRACLHKREILSKIFYKAGYTWSSTILDSSDFKRRVQPPTEPAKLTDTVINNHKFLAVASGSQVITDSQVNFQISTFVTGFANANLNVCEFPTETYDTGNIYNNIGFVFTVPDTANYNIAGALNLGFVVKRNGIDVNSNVSINQATGVHVKLYNSFTATTTALFDLNIQGNQGDLATNTYNAIVELNNVQLTAGHLYYVVITIANVTITYTAPVAGASWTLETTINSGSNFSAELSSTDLYEGATVLVNDLLPKNYKQSDFVTDLRKEYNLYFMPDKNIPNNILIEDRPNFFFTTARNWSDKHDKSSPVSIKPMGELNFNRLNLSHAQDGDFYNKLYEDEFKNVYGSYQKNITNDFIKGENNIQLGIAATPYALNLPTGVVLPQIYKKDNTNISPLKIKPRSWYWSGLINMPVGCYWTFVYNNGANSVVYTTMPHAGHTNNPWAPTIDLSFNVPDKVYFNYPNQTWTNNNLYNKYYSQYINQITDKNSKIIRTKFYLDANDIHIFDFRYPIFAIINDEQGYYLVNKIEQYNPLVSETTMVELLKLTEYPVFTPTVENSGGGGGNNTGWEMIFNQNITKGPNNFNYGSNSMVLGGSGNFLSNATESVTLLNSEGVAVSRVQNFFGVGLNKNSTIQDDTVNLYDSLIVGQAGVKALRPAYTTVYSDFEIDGEYGLYYLNPNYFGLALTCSWNPQSFKGTIVFKMIDNTSPPTSFTITNDGSPPGLVEGTSGSKSFNLGFSGSIIVHSDGNNLNVIAEYE